jgi:hypothetical protein
MKTETLELTKIELDYLLTLVTEHINSGMYWGDQEQFNKMEDRVLEKIEQAYNSAFNHKVKS